jgi:hypothetical protein
MELIAALDKNAVNTIDEQKQNFENVFEDELID